MIVATRPLIDCCPIVPAAMEGRQIAQWDKDSCSDAGFLKIDLLGLGMLSAVERSVELIARTRGERIDLSRIPYDDPATYECIQNADTTGVFQIESRAQMQSLRRTRPENLQDITIQVAIVRPGPIQGGAVNPYIERRQRLRVDPSYEVPYEHPSLEPVLRETLGHDHLPGPGARGGDRVRRLLTRRGGGTAASDEPQALGGGDRGLPPAVRRRRQATARGGRGDRRAGVLDGPGLLGLRLSQGPRRRVRAARLPVDVAAGPLQPGVPVLAAQRAADGLLSARCARPRGAATRDRGAGARRQRERGGVRDRATLERRGTGRVRIGLGYVRGVREQEVTAVDLGAPGGGTLPQPRPISPRGPGRARPRSSCSPGRAPATRSCDGMATPSSARRIALWQLGVATPGRQRPRRDPAGAPARPAGAAEAARAVAVGVDARRLRRRPG